ncbi:hypothetical protein HAX54_024103 [Datura stramonium]|uniref:Secreted protein n=1 Tax=Datura stramonium TaxID=4076 RepID=A0ABS8UXH0_DATST|nr:hypothetical protein [Datura stramonium]
MPRKNCSSVGINPIAQILVSLLLALCNPPNTAVFPTHTPYTDERDDSLGPEGDLCAFILKTGALGPAKQSSS